MDELFDKDHNELTDLVMSRLDCPSCGAQGVLPIARRKPALRVRCTDQDGCGMVFDIQWGTLRRWRHILVQRHAITP